MILKNTKLWAGITSIIAGLLCIVVIGTSVVYAYSGYVNHALGIVTSEIVNDTLDNEDTLYYKSQYGDFDSEGLTALQAATKLQNINEMREGAALLYNDSNALPLASNSKLSLFGRASAVPLYQGSSAGTKIDNNTEDKASYKDSLEEEGFTINNTIWEALVASTTVRNVSSATNFEETPSFYDARISEVGEYDDAAIVMFSREGSEGKDLLMKDTDDDGETIISCLALHSNERTMLQKVRSKFDKVIVLLNSPWQMEVEEIKQYCDAILFIGCPGQYGFIGVAEILSGKVNPSGHLSDTYAVNSLSAPACVNSGTNTPKYSNATAINSQIGKNEKAEYASFQAEGIYVGYKYYETRYADCVTGRGNATAATGASNGATSWNYSNEVSYPFGYGLSYTTFSQVLDRVEVLEDTIKVYATVTNTGSVAGKSVVQAYAQTPYGEYEISNKVEKSAIQLAGFAKSNLLEPSASQEVVITIDKYLLASYDYTNAETYYLSAGDYYIAIGENSHDALNNILTLCGYDTEDGMDYNGFAAKAYKFIGVQDTEKYAYGENNTKIENQFENCDLNYYTEGAGVYLSRNNWESTYPTEQTIITANTDMIKGLNGEFYVKPADAPDYGSVAIKFGVNSNLTLAKMRSVPITDIETWRKFIFQINIEELPLATVEGFSTKPVGILSPSIKVGDGCDSVGGTIKLYQKSGTNVPQDASDRETVAVRTVRYCSKPILTGTFNSQLYAGRGNAMGEEALWCGLMENYCVGPNLHRTPFAGRNFEYMSEDSIMSYLAAIPEVRAMEATGTHAAPKHFAGNDQEFQREGVSVYFNEQGFREGSLRGFEGALRVARAGGLMQSFERLGTVWASATYALNTSVLRKEWGWTGNCVTDGAAAGTNFVNNYGYKDHTIEVFAAGTNQWCLDSTAGHGIAALEIAKETDDGNILELMISSAIYWEYAIANSCAVNGMSENATIRTIAPWWEEALSTITIVMSSLTGVSGVMLLLGTALNVVDEKRRLAK